MKTKLSIYLISIATSFSVFGVDIENKDKKSYQIEYDDAGTKHNGILNPGKKMSSICGECKVRIQGIGTLQAAGSDKIVIQNGAAKVE